MKHTCDKHPMYMKQGKNNFTNLMCKLCDTYIKHSSHYELKVYEWYQSNNEHHHLTVEQVIEEAQELKEETFHLDPEQYIDAYGDNVIWMSVHYRNKELAKQYKALWEPRIKMWYTYVDHPQAIKLIEWMTEEDVERVQDYVNNEEHMTNIYKNIIDVRRKQLSIQRSEANIKASMNNVKNNKQTR
tara:strand:- start:1291 stop:1848 length:558 start_codon:yes stop_codon:yes gene_type:complete